MNNDTCQETLLSLLEDTIKLLEENGIWYSLACGSVLGAVREGGFIPWDRDIDFFVKIEDVEKIQRIFDEQKDSKLTLISYRRDTTSTHDKVSYAGLDHTQTHIDLYPLIGAPEEEKQRERFIKKCHFWNKIYACKHENVKTVRKWYKKIVFSCLQLFEKCIPDSVIRKKVAKIEQKYDFQTAKYLCYFANDGHLNEAMEREILLETKESTFEGRSVKIPRDADRYLRNVYGDDYMTPKQY